MSLTRLNLPNGFINRGSMNLLGAGELFTTGNVYYVDSVRGSDGNLGTDPDFPKASIDNAVSSCVADQGDIIVAMPNHVETVIAAAGLDLDIAGITLIGLGSGSNRPQINFTTATTADMDVGAADITMINFLFTGGVDALVCPIDINSDDFSLINCEYRDVTGSVEEDGIRVNAARVKIQDFEYAGSISTGTNAAIVLGTEADSFVLEGFRIDGNFSSAVLYGNGSSENIKIANGYLRTRNAADIAIDMHADTTGDIGPDIYIRIQDDTTNITEAVDSATNCQFFDPIMIVNADGERGLQWNEAVSADA